MSVLVVGLSHKSAPVSTLERAAVSGDTLGKLLHDVARLPDIAETFVISTCNRVEVYAEVGRFHGGVAGVCDLLSRYSGIPAAELTSSLYVHYEDRAIQHLLAVSSGLESMVVGEDQILGQVRAALKAAGDYGTLGRSLRDLGRVALRTGKRARAETGIDRLALRRLNQIPPDLVPYAAPSAMRYDSGDYPAALAKALASAGYPDLREQQAKRRASGDVVQLGIGVSCYVEITGPGAEEGGPRENATVEVHPDGSATILTGTSPHGQGHVTVWAMLASEELGIGVDKITVKWGDTDLIPEGGGTGGSRSLQQGGAAVRQASQDLLDVARQRAADELEANPADLVFDTGSSSFAVAGAVSAAYAISSAFSAPFLGGLVDRRGQTAVLIGGATVAALALTTAGILPHTAPPMLLVAPAALAGAAASPLAGK